jgi:ABC-type multidrug transport system permease subunit
MSKEKNLEGIGGWLILVAIGIVVTPIRIIALVISTLPQIFSTGVWEAWTTQGSEIYNPLLATFIAGEIFINCGLLLVWLYIAYKFFTKSKDFPKWYIGVAVFSLIFIIVDAFAIHMALPIVPVFDPDTTKEVIRALIMVVIWVPYMLVSKRVKATFIN